MKRQKKRIVKVQEDEITVVEIEVDQKVVDFYKKETGRTHVTQRGLSKFINNLVELHRP